MIFMWYLKESQQHIALSLRLPQLSREYLTISMRILLCALLVRIMITASGYGVRCPCILIQACIRYIFNKVQRSTAFVTILSWSYPASFPSSLPHPWPNPALRLACARYMFSRRSTTDMLKNFKMAAGLSMMHL